MQHIRSRGYHLRSCVRRYSLEDVVATAEGVLNAAHVPSEIRDETLSRLAESRLTISRLQLIFNYKVAFESMRS